MSRNESVPFALTVLLALAASLLGCRSTPRDPVAALLADLEAAAEARDVSALEKRLASGFTGQGSLARAQALDQTRRYFALYEEVRLEVYGVEAQGKESLVFVVDFSGHAKAIGGLSSLLPPEAAYRFDCELLEEGGVLKLSKASWKAVPLPGEGEGVGKAT
jgi:hypothetical protein